MIDAESQLGKCPDLIRQAEWGVLIEVMDSTLIDS